MTKDELTTALGNLESTVEIKGGKWDRDMFTYVLAQCADLSEAGNGQVPAVAKLAWEILMPDYIQETKL